MSSQENSCFVRGIAILASIATIAAACIAAIELIPTFGQWLAPREPISYNQKVTPTITMTPPAVTHTPPPSIPTATSTPTKVNSDIVFGPVDGSLPHQDKKWASLHNAGVSLRDFVGEVVFYNPYSREAQSWDVGFTFRGTAQGDQLRLIIASSGDWYLYDRWNSKDTLVASGKVVNLNIESNGSNQVCLIAVDSKGFLIINQTFVARLDISSRISAGDVAVTTGMLSGNSVAGAVTRFEKFTIRSTVIEPYKGDLKHEKDNSIGYYNAGVDLYNFVCEATFYNPYSIEKGPWDIGFIFRSANATNHLRLIILSNGSWQLYNRWNGQDNFVANGQATGLNLGTGEFNQLTLFAFENKGVLFVNNILAAELDLSTRINSGDIATATGIMSGNRIAGAVTPFENFMIWSIP